MLYVIGFSAHLREIKIKATIRINKSGNGPIVENILLK